MGRSGDVDAGVVEAWEVEAEGQKGTTRLIEVMV